MGEYELYITGQELPRALSKEEEKALLDRYFLQGDQEAKDQLIIHNLRLARKVIRMHPNDEIAEEDFYSYAAENMVKAIDKYDYSASNIALSTYFTTCLENLLMLLLRNANFKKRKGNVISIDTTIYESNGTEDVLLSDKLESDENVQEEVVTKLENEDLMKQIIEIVKQMDVRRQRIFYSYWGLCGHKAKKISEIAMDENLSTQRINIILKDIQEKIKIGLKLLPAPSKKRRKRRVEEAQLV
ncbi:MAG: sigma-70 family RNA polymerase sigma factor [Clostridia bacterium]|nr:sigma-70 family RNA polymerase sigma factor [Clostridia bacterium]